MTDGDDILSKIDDLLRGHVTDGDTSDDAMAVSYPKVDQELLDFFGGEIISAYTRADFIADGGLIEVPLHVAARFGFRAPMAFTSAAWHDTVAWTDSDTDHVGCVPEDQEGRLDAAMQCVCRAMTRAMTEPHPIPWTEEFTVSRMPRDPAAARGDDGPEYKDTTLILHLGLGDHGEGVITIMQPHER